MNKQLYLYVLIKTPEPNFSLYLLNLCTLQSELNFQESLYSNRRFLFDTGVPSTRISSRSGETRIS